MNDRITVYQGDCLEVMKTLQAESVDSVVTDPPAGIAFMGKEWDKSRGGRREWSQWLSVRLQECWRVAKPGAHILCWALPRTSHWTACALEDAGWNIEDRVAHVFGTGFPKHKSKLKPAVEDWWLATKPGGEKWLGVDACRIEGHSYTQEEWNSRGAGGGNSNIKMGQNGDGQRKAYAEGLIKVPSGRWPTNLVLSHHPECKPNGIKKVKVAWSQPVVGDRSGTCVYASGNGLPNAHLGKTAGYADPNGVEAVQAFDCHPDCPVRILDEQSGELKTGGSPESKIVFGPFESVAKGKEPSRVISSPHFGSSGCASRFFNTFENCHPDCPVRILDEQSGESKGRREELLGWASNKHEGWKREAHKNYETIMGGYDDSGGASRFFPGFLYCPKANRKDRGEGNNHPTVKAEPLMRWLCKLVTPPGGTILDPFAGSGSTGFAAEAEGFQSILIEQSPEYVQIIKQRMTNFQDKTPLFM